MYNKYKRRKIKGKTKYIKEIKDNNKNEQVSDENTKIKRKKIMNKKEKRRMMERMEGRKRGIRGNK